MSDATKKYYKPGVYRDVYGNLYYILGRFRNIGTLLCIPHDEIYSSLRRPPKELEWERDFLAPGQSLEDVYKFSPR